MKESIRASIVMAESPSTHTSILEKLAKHKSVAVRVAVAMNPRTPEDVLVDLAADGDESVSLRARKTWKEVRSGADERPVKRKCVVKNHSETKVTTDLESEPGASGTVFRAYYTSQFTEGTAAFNPPPVCMTALQWHELSKFAAQVAEHLDPDISDGE